MWFPWECPFCTIKGPCVHIKTVGKEYTVAKAAELPQKSLKTLAALAISRLDNQAIWTQYSNQVSLQFSYSLHYHWCLLQCLVMVCSVHLFIFSFGRESLRMWGYTMWGQSRYYCISWAGPGSSTWLWSLVPFIDQGNMKCSFRMITRRIRGCIPCA